MVINSAAMAVGRWQFGSNGRGNSAAAAMSNSAANLVFDSAVAAKINSAAAMLVFDSAAAGGDN